MYLFVLSLQAYGLDYQSVLYIKKKKKLSEAEEAGFVILTTCQLLAKCV